MSDIGVSRLHVSLIGVRHEPDTLKSALRTTYALQPRKVGLELPPDYKTSGKLNYFEVLAREFRNRQISVVPLDSVVLREQARRIIYGHVSGMVSEFEIHAKRSEHMAEVVLKEAVPVVVVGTLHAADMLEMLPCSTFVHLLRDNSSI